MTLRPTVLLFDIDGTLVDTQGIGRRALERAFGELHGHWGACAAIQMDGMTDRSIVRAALVAAAIPDTERAIDQVIERYLLLLKAALGAGEKNPCRVHRGIDQALSRAERRPRLGVGLGTGNVRAGARLKLSPVGLFDRFTFGGFGCDHENRTELLRRGAERGAERLGVPLAECRVAVIGDTPKDVLAAKGIGAESIGVATGRFSVDQLLAAGATAAFESLEESGAIDAVLEG